MPAEKYITNPCKNCGCKERFKSNYGCTDCLKISTKKWRYSTKGIKNYETKVKGKKKRLISNRNSRLKRIYGITNYEELLKQQNNSCAICLKPEEDTWKGKIKKLAVDHNHKTGKIRKLLCGNCNRALGLIKENETIAQNLLHYIKEVC